MGDRYRPDTVTVYRSLTDGQVRWTWVAAIGRTLGDSGEGYMGPTHCRTQAKRLANGVGANYVDTTTSH